MAEDQELAKGDYIVARAPTQERDPGNFTRVF
jgi:hypothetical protein